MANTLFAKHTQGIHATFQLSRLTPTLQLYLQPPLMLTSMSHLYPAIRLLIITVEKREPLQPTHETHDNCNYTQKLQKHQKQSSMLRHLHTIRSGCRSWKHSRFPMKVEHLQAQVDALFGSQFIVQDTGDMHTTFPFSCLPPPPPPSHCTLNHTAHMCTMNSHQFHTR